MRVAAWMCCLGIAAVTAPAAWSTAQSRAPRDEGAMGRQLYRTHCANCHGTSGRGDGPMAQYLTVAPPDLTGIAARHNGVFPTEVVHRIVDGRRVLRLHGDSAMPIWGDAFSLPGGDRAEERIRAVVAYLEGLQKRSGE